jgi:hypothetical protein
MKARHAAIGVAGAAAVLGGGVGYLLARQHWKSLREEAAAGLRVSEANLKLFKDKIKKMLPELKATKARVEQLARLYKEARTAGDSATSQLQLQLSEAQEKQKELTAHVDDLRGEVIRRQRLLEQAEARAKQAEAMALTTRKEMEAAMGAMKTKLEEAETFRTAKEEDAAQWPIPPRVFGGDRFQLVAFNPAQRRILPLRDVASGDDDDDENESAVGPRI